MKYLSEKVCCVALAGLLASCAVSGEPATTPQVQTTPEALAIDLNDVLKRLEKIGKSVAYVRGGNVACSCSPTVVPNRPWPPPPPWDQAAVKRAILALQALEKGYETNKLATILPAAQH
jgi:hypothetical protein